MLSVVLVSMLPKLNYWTDDHPIRLWQTGFCLFGQYLILIFPTGNWALIISVFSVLN